MDSSFNHKDGQMLIKELFNEHYRRLVHFSFQIVNDKAIAEDVVQEAFIKYWDYCHTLSSNSAAIKSFLYRSVKNASLNVMRHTKVTQKHILSQDSNPSEDSIMNAIIRSEVLAEIYKALESLPQACQEISRMGYFDGKKNHEIADELGISINTVKTQKQRALKLLRLRLSPEIFGMLILLSHFQ